MRVTEAPRQSAADRCPDRAGGARQPANARSAVIDVGSARVALSFVPVAAADSALLFAPERALISAGMTESRRRELVAGRMAAHRAIAAAGRPAGPVGKESGRPVFPHGLAGSLSHSGGWAVAAVGVGRL